MQSCASAKFCWIDTELQVWFLPSLDCGLADVLRSVASFACIWQRSSSFEGFQLNWIRVAFGTSSLLVSAMNTFPWNYNYLFIVYIAHFHAPHVFPAKSVVFAHACFTLQGAHYCAPEILRHAKGRKGPWAPVVKSRRLRSVSPRVVTGDGLT